MNYLLLESIDLYEQFWGKQGKRDTRFTDDVARRIVNIFKKNESGSRPVHGKNLSHVHLKQLGTIIYKKRKELTKDYMLVFDQHNYAIQVKAEHNSFSSTSR